MKSRLTTIILFIIMIILIAGIILFGIFIYKELNVETSNQVVYNIEKSNNIDTLSSETTSTQKTTDDNIFKNIQNIFSGNKIDTPQYTNLEEKFFYKQLTDNQQIIYNGLDNNKKYLKQGDYVINFGETFSEILALDNGNKILGDDYQSAIEAFLHDNPDLFYLDVNKMYLNIETTQKLLKTTFNVYISPAEGKNYLEDGFNAKDLVNQIKMVEQEKNNILKNLPASTYERIVYIHDYLIDSIEYDSTFNAQGSYGLYGALVNKKCVCEGYAKALKYLLNAIGIECEIMQGIATNTANQTENHAWNCVNVDGKWYLVDATWDDPIIIGNGNLNNEIKHKYLLKGLANFEKDHVIEYKFSENGRFFSYPQISILDY